MRYRFTVDEQKKLTFFLVETVEQLQKIADEAVHLTPDTAQSRLRIDRILVQLQRIKGQASFFGLMEMMLLIRQVQSMLEVMRCGQLGMDAMAVDVLLDAKNILGEMTFELTVASEKIQGTEELDMELACAQEAECLVAFIGQLLQKKLSTALVLVPQQLVSKLPAIIHKKLIKPKAQPDRSVIDCHATHNGESPKTESAVSESVVINTSTTVSDATIQQLLGKIRELRLTNNATHQLSHTLLQEHQLPKLAREARNIGQLVNGIVADLEEKVLSMGRVELGLIFLQFPHILNAVAKQNGKDISLTVTGEHMTVDKLIVKPLSNLLLTIICTMARLSIESPAQREAVGKEGQGQIRLVAYSIGKDLVIEIEDDGQSMKGVDADAKVLEIAALMVTMNEVYHQMDAFPGQLEMTSPPDKGSNIRITLPPPIMKCSGLLVEVAGELFIVPVDQVIEMVSVTAQQLISTRGRKLLYQRGEVLGVVSLAELLDLKVKQTDGTVPVVIVTNGQDKIGLLVHKLHNEQEIILKPLPDYLKNSDYIQGAAVTRDGKVALVLKVSALIKKISLSNG